MRFSFNPLALDEASHAAQWYREEGSPKAAIDFALSVEAAIALIRKHPGIGTPGTRKTHRLTLDTFPFWLVYRIEEGQLRIISIAHQRRRPGYWAKRR